MQDLLGDRMKAYEIMETGRQFLPGLPIVVRLDGKGFHKFTKGLHRPYDERLSKCMIDTTKFLVEKTDAVIGYTQSDEITLVYLTDTWGGEMFFNRKIQKLTSVLASMCTAKFNEAISKNVSEKRDILAFFDCRTFQVPNKEEAVNCLIWREKDATKNSISMAAMTVFPHKQLHNKNGKEKCKMLLDKGINWDNCPVFFKRGTYVARREVVLNGIVNIEMLPEQHNARKNIENFQCTRSFVMELDMPILSTITNRVAVVFDKAVPELNTVETIVHKNTKEYDRISYIMSLQDDWDNEGAEKPSIFVINQAKNIIDWASEFGLVVDDVSADVLGGIGVFLSGKISDRTVWIACHNSGDIYLIKIDNANIHSNLNSTKIIWNEESKVNIVKFLNEN